MPELPESSATGDAGTGRLLSVDLNGVARVERQGIVRTLPIHRGCRIASFGADRLDPSKMLLAFEGGGGPQPAQAMFLAAVSPDGVEAVARDLLAAVERHRAGRAIDMRFIV